MDVPLFPLLLAAMIAIAAGIWIASRGRGVISDDEKFVRSAQQTDAEVLEVRTRYPDPVHRDHDDWWYVPVVRFALPDGRVVEAETMTGSRPAPATEGQQVRVRYDPADPTRVSLAQGLAQKSNLGGLQMALGIGISVLGLMMLGFWALIVLVLKIPV